MNISLMLKLQRHHTKNHRLRIYLSINNICLIWAIETHPESGNPSNKQLSVSEVISVKNKLTSINTISMVLHDVPWCHSDRTATPVVVNFNLVPQTQFFATKFHLKERIPSYNFVHHVHFLIITTKDSG